MEGSLSLEEMIAGNDEYLYFAKKKGIKKLARNYQKELKRFSDVGLIRQQVQIKGTQIKMWSLSW